MNVKGLFFGGFFFFFFWNSASVSFTSVDLIKVSAVLVGDTLS